MQMLGHKGRSIVANGSIKQETVHFWSRQEAYELIDGNIRSVS